MRKITAIAFAFFLNAVFLFGQTSPVDSEVSRFLARYITTLLNKGNSSFPSDEANVVLQTKDGYMWFGGYNGLCRYDGTKFTVWDAVSPNGFGSSNIRALYEDKEGILWIGTNDKGLVSYKDGIFKTYDRSLGLPSNTIRSIAEDSEGRIICGTLEGIFSIDRGENIALLRLDTAISQAVISLCFDNNDNLYAVLNSGELFVRNSKGATYRHSHQSPFNAVKSVSGDRVVAGTRRGDVFILRFDAVNGGFPRSDVITTPIRTIESIYEDSNGYIWLAAENGIGYLDAGENYRHAGDPSGVGFYRSICEDYQNGYWIAATRGGVTKLTVSAFTDFNALYQIDTGGANAFIMDGDDIYIGTNNGIFIINKDGAPVHERLKKIVSGRVRSISRDSRGNIWVCTYSDLGVIRYTPSTNNIAFWTPEDGMDTDRTRYAYELPNGVMAVATAVGINFIKDDKVVTVYEALNTEAYIDLPDIMVLSLITSYDGTLYAGTDGNGIYAINREGTTRYREEDGLTGGVVMRMLANPNENGVWVSASPGLCYIDGDRKSVSVINKVPPYTFLDIMQYKDELVLLTSEMIINTNADNLLNDGLPFVYSSIGQSHGLNGQINANAWNVITNSGDLYFCTTTGCKYRLREDFRKYIIPYAGISKIQVDGIDYSDFRSPIVVPRETDRITFELSFLSFGLLDDAVLRYKLLGYNNEPATLFKNDLLDISYTNLRGGSYTMQVWTEDQVGNKGNSIEVNIYKQKWLLEYVFVWVVIALLTVAFTAFLVWSVARYRLRELARLSELKLDALTARLEKEKAEESERAKGEFVAIISHELRTPMNAINGMAEILLRGELSVEAREYVQDIKKAGNSLLVLVNDILDFSKIEAGKLEIITAKYKFSSLINDTVNIIRMRLMEKDVQFFTDVDDTIPNNLLGDEVRIRQILINLLSNAVKFTDHGHINLSIKTDKRDNETIWLRIAVTDTGKGIKPEDQEKLFRNFVQVDTEANHNIHGTGLGLAITKKLCEAMGGNVSVQSEYGKGSAFTVVIPQKIDCSAEAAETLADVNFKSIRDGKGYTKRSSVTRYVFPRSRLLVVDDLPANLKVAEGLLSPYKAVVDVCTNGADAVELVKYKKYDIIFMDHLMPEMNGVEAAEKIREWEKEQKKTNRTPIIALTANVTAGQAEKFMESDFDDFLAKPIDIIKLDELLVKWIDQKKKVKAHETKQQPARDPRVVISIPNVDVHRGITMTGGTLEKYKEVLSVFCDNMRERLPLFQKLPDKKEMPSFILAVHTIKSASSTIGATEISEMAEELENAGKKSIAFEDEESRKAFEYIEEKIPIFVEKVKELMYNIGNNIDK